MMRLCNRTTRKLLWLLLSGGGFWLVADAAPDCDLQCQNGGFCDDGPPLPSTMGNYLGTSSSVDPAQILMELQAEDARFLTHHCVCPTGYTGPYCQDSTNVVVHCRDHSHCLNGGTCNTQNGFCNCRVTVQDIGSGVQHVGRHCEHTVATRFGPQQCNNTAAANNHNNNEPTYCANGGVCNQESRCDCPPEYAGVRCEYNRNDMASCRMECLNGGQCRWGSRNITVVEHSLGVGHHHANFAGMHCACPQGFTGRYCEILHTDCPASASTDLFCLHESPCVNITDNNNNNNNNNDLDISEPQYHCDCRSANNDDTSFAGVRCEHEATGFCEKSPGVNGQSFCTNNGTCFQHENGVYGCNCTEGYWGDRCELRRDDPDVPDSYLECRLQCQNGGVCREGLKDHGILHQYGGLNSITQNTSVLDPLDGGIEHCECPPGYAGVTCEHPIQVCGGGDGSSGGNNHVCLHGSQCVLQENQRDYKCECNTGNSNRNLQQQQTPTAGAHCQHKASSICTTPLDDSGSLMFCVNGGNCQDEDHRHCDCPQGFLGRHCEFHRDELLGNVAPQEDEDDDFPLAEAQSNGNNDGGALVALSVSIVFVVLSLSAVLTFMVVRRRRQRRRSLTEQNYFDDEHIVVEEEEDEDDGHARVVLAEQEGFYQSRRGKPREII